MLVHMTPGEVQALQTLAERHGGTLTINPETGQPEANFLKKLLPTIAGFALAPLTAGTSLAFLGATPLASALTVGSITGLATGSLSRGLMAGLGAYGGASLGAGLANAGQGAIAAGDIAAQQAAGTFPTLAEGATQAQVADYASQVGALRDTALSKAGEAGFGAKMSAGLGQMASNPGTYAKDALMSGYAAVSPMMAADTVKTTTPRADTGYIRQKKFNPYTQQYIDLEPVKASEWGSRSFSDFADGGIVALAKGGTYSAADIQGYLGANPGMSDVQIASAMNQFGVTPAQMAAATGLSLGDVQGRFDTAQRDISGIQNLFQSAYPTATAANISDYMNQPGMAANVRAALQDPSMQALYGTSEGGTPFTADASLYQLQTGGSFAPVAGAINKWVSENVGTYKTAKAADDARDRAENAMLKAGMNEFDVLKATGKTLDQIFSFSPDKIVKTTTTTTVPDGGGGSATDNWTATTPATYAPPGTTNPYGNRVTPGDLTFNRDGSVTVQPNIPGRPYGGFTGIQQLKDAYTAGGGSLGQSNLFVPKTPAELYERYGATGGSKQAYDYLTGKGAADIRRPVTSGQLMRPYAEAVLGQELAAATGKSTQRFIFDARTGRYIPNPAYVDPNAAKDKEKTTAPTVDESMGAAEGGVMRMALGGLGALAGGGQAGYNLGGYSDGGRLLRGPGDGVSDSIPATIGDKQPARLADGEFVVPARIVSELGNGSTEAGARKLYAMMDRVQKARGKTTGKRRVATDTRADKYLPA
jgi:hypothetical protein